jgi:DNA-binding transcriptional regulator LsrR (DeoR family)
MNDQLLQQVAFTAVRLYAETHPRPPQVTQRQAAEMLGLSAPTIGRMVKAGTLRLNAAGLIPISEIDAALLAKAA